MPEVYLVCGPPCSGKSTYVAQNRQPGDLVVDYDDIAQRLGSPVAHNHHPKYHRRVEQTIERAMAGIKAGRHERAWVIRTLPVPSDRESLAASLNATVVLLDEPDKVLHARAAMRSDTQATLQAIHTWRRRSEESS